MALRQACYTDVSVHDIKGLQKNAGEAHKPFFYFLDGRRDKNESTQMTGQNMKPPVLTQEIPVCLLPDTLLDTFICDCQPHY